MLPESYGNPHLQNKPLPIFLFRVKISFVKNI